MSICSQFQNLCLFLFQEESERKEAKKKKQIIKTINLPVEALTHGYSQLDLNNYIEQEVSL